MRHLLLTPFLAVVSAAPSYAAAIVRLPASLEPGPVIAAPVSAGATLSAAAPALPVAASGLALPSPSLVMAAASAAPSAAAAPASVAPAAPDAAPAPAPAAPADKAAAAPAPAAAAKSSLEGLGRAVAAAAARGEGKGTAAALDKGFTGSRGAEAEEEGGADVAEAAEPIETETFAASNPRVLDARYGREVARAKLLTPEEERALGLRKAAGDRRARQELVARNLRLVMKIAFQYRNYGFPVDDLVQEGNIGLIKAVDRFDAARGYRLSTYASWWIRSVIGRYIMDNWHLGHTMTTPGERKLFYALRAAQKTLAHQLGEDAANDPERVAAFVNAQTAQKRRDEEEDEAGGVRVKAADVEKMSSLLGQPIVSLDAPAAKDGDSGSGAHVDLVPGSGAPQDELLDDARRQDRLARATREAIAAVSLKNPRYGRIISARLMADEDDTKTLLELGTEFGLSRERVRQLEAKAKDALAAELRLRLAGSGVLDE